MESPRRPWQKWVVGLTITAIVVSTLGMVGFIWYRWHDVQEPTTAIIIDGDPSLNGTVITVTGLRQITTSLQESNNYTAPVLVEPGIYLVEAKQQDGRLLLQTQVEVKRFLGVRFNLSQHVKQTNTGQAGPPPATGY